MVSDIRHILKRQEITDGQLQLVNTAHNFPIVECTLIIP